MKEGVSFEEPLRQAPKPAVCVASQVPEQSASSRYPLSGQSAWAQHLLLLARQSLPLHAREGHGCLNNIGFILRWDCLN